MLTQKPSRASGAFAVVLLAALSGCGNSSNTTKTRPLTRAELEVKAGAICQRVIKQVDWSKLTAAELPGLVARLAALEEQAASELEKLTPPTSMLEKWRIIVDDFRLTGPEFRKIAKEVQANGAQAYGRLPLSNAQHERGLEANIAHIKGCVEY